MYFDFFLRKKIKFAQFFLYMLHHSLWGVGRGAQEYLGHNGRDHYVHYVQGASFKLVLTPLSDLSLTLSIYK